MSEHDDSNIESAFLDMITNCVGILIILVMVVGQIVKEAPLRIAAEMQLNEVSTLKTKQIELQDEVDLEQQRLAEINRELAFHVSERDELNTVVSAVERDIDQQRSDLDSKSQTRFDLARDLELARASLGRLQGDKAMVPAKAPARVISIENLPTPMAKADKEKTIHFRLQGKRLAFLPAEALFRKFEKALQDILSRALKFEELEGSVGPIEGFRLHYALEKVYRGGANTFNLPFVELLPERDIPSESIDAALRANSRFRSRLNLLNPEDYAITLAVYPDSYAEYQQLKAELHRLGFAITARPLIEDEPIRIALGRNDKGMRSSQ